MNNTRKLDLHAVDQAVGRMPEGTRLDMHPSGDGFTALRPDGSTAWIHCDGEVEA